MHHPNATELLMFLKKTQGILQDNINKSVQSYKGFADKKSEEGPEIKAKSWVMLSSKFLKFKFGVKKLSPKFVGPFKVAKEIGKVAFKLILPETRKINPIFHHNLLKTVSQKNT